MIRGGTQAAGKSGNLRTSLTQVFLPCQLFLVPAVYKRRLENNSNLTWNAYAELESTSGATIRLNACSYFQVQKTLIGGLETANLTIEKPEIWSIWGSQYPEELRPSKRRIKIFAGFPGAEINIFTGRIIYTSESRGSGAGNLGAINLTCNDHRSLLQKETSSQYATDVSRFFEIYRQLSGFISDTSQLIYIAESDSIGNFRPLGNKYDAANAALPGQAAWSIAAGAAAITGNDETRVISSLLSITDKQIKYATRNFADSTAYNVVNARGLVDGELSEQEVTDAADIAKRGRVVYSGFVGTDADQLSDAILQAQAIISRSLQGTVSAQILFNPYLLPGMPISFASSRFNIAAGLAKVYAVRHQYRHGSCLTALDSLEVIGT